MSAGGAALKAEILEKNRAEYDFASDRLWRLTHYEPNHAGWWFSSIGGRQVLEALGEQADLGPGRQVLEICCGLGDACRYLAERFACRATGIDINEQQIALAQERTQALAPRLAFQVADVVAWQPPRVFDAAFGLDALGLLENRRRALRTAARALVPGGVLLLAEVLAGPAYSGAVRRFVWDEDGILDLPTGAEQAAMLEDLGFRDVERRDLTHLGVECFANMQAACRRHRDVLVADKGAPRFRRWARNARIYRRCFHDRALVYEQITARLTT